MKHNRNRAVKKERLNKNVKLNVATNFALAFLIFSVGFVCLFPVEDAVTTDGSEKNVYRSASAETDGRFPDVQRLLGDGRGVSHSRHAGDAQGKGDLFYRRLLGRSTT